MKKILLLCILVLSAADARIISLQDLVEENYTESELENDKGFAYFKTPKINLISFASSGNTWTRYALEYLTKHPSHWHFKGYSYETKPLRESKRQRTLDRGRGVSAMNPPFGAHYSDMGVDFLNPPIIKRHKPWVISESEGSMVLMRKTDKVIFLLRNYQELYFRRRKQSYHSDPRTLLVEYFKLIALYDLWTDENKLLVYYEDLIEKPEITFSKMLDFLQVSSEHLEGFLKDKELHKKRCMEVYSQARGVSKSQGLQALFYSKGANKNLLKRIENELKTKWPKLFQKYLKRYEI